MTTADPFANSFADPAGCIAIRIFDGYTDTRYGVDAVDANGVATEEMWDAHTKEAARSCIPSFIKEYGLPPDLPVLDLTTEARVR